MSGLRRAIVRQFSRPSGFAGHLAGWIMANRPSNRRRNAWTIELISPRKGERLLEIGCGPGIALAYCAGRAEGVRLVGLDHSPIMLAQARRRLCREAPQGEWRLEAGGLERLAEWGGQFDGVWSVNVIQFMPDMERAFLSILSVLKPGGRAVTSYQPRHKAPTREDALNKAADVAAAMEAAGFVDIRSEVLELKPVPAVSVIGRKR